VGNDCDNQEWENEHGTQDGETGKGREKATSATLPTERQMRSSFKIHVRSTVQLTPRIRIVEWKVKIECLLCP